MKNFFAVMAISACVIGTVTSSVALAKSANTTIETLSIKQKGIEGTIQEAFTKRDVSGSSTEGEYSSSIHVSNASEGSLFKVSYAISKIKDIAAEAGRKVYSKAKESKLTGNPSSEDIAIECFGGQDG